MTGRRAPSLWGAAAEPQATPAFPAPLSELDEPFASLSVVAFSGTGKIRQSLVGRRTGARH